MQVAHVNDHVTHAIIGGADTIDFGISSSAEFFNILSSTLYKDQILAVVREVLCNAWDAHIEAGITDKPVEITLTESNFTIRDFGSGIHRDDMGPIYGTYGNSTKKNDGKQTGGFGLGCKAPFAYTDHFEVNSYHDGIRTIYNLSKSSAQAQGKPGIVPIASFPTTETGLQVSIDIATRADYYKFLKLIHRIVSNGDMNMKVNDEIIECLGFDASVNNFIITSKDVLDTNTSIMVRYGNVIYPIDDITEISSMYKDIKNHINVISFYGRHRIIFQAPPHSISVTPSRESLSMQEHTVNTLKMLFKGYLDMINNPVSGFRQLCDIHAEIVVKEAVKEKRIYDLLSNETVLPFSEQRKNIVAVELFDISDLDTMAKTYIDHIYPNDPGFRKKDITWRLKGLVDAKLLDRGLVQSYLAVLKTEANTNLRSTWLQKKVIAPLLVKLVEAKMDHKKLYVYDGNDGTASRIYDRAPLVAATSAAPLSHLHTLPYLRNVVVISTSLKDVVLRATLRPEFKQIKNYNGFLFYHVGMKKNDRENALKFFKDSGMLVIDLTHKLPSEIAEKAVGTLARKPALKGLVSLLSVNSLKYGIDTRQSANSVNRTEHPEFIVQLSMANNAPKDTFENWKNASSRAIIDLFGAKGAITFNSVVHKKWLDKGVKEMDDYVVEKVVAEMTNNKRIHEYWAFDSHRTIEASDDFSHYSSNDLIHAVYESTIMRKHFGLIDNLIDTDKLYVHLWNHLTSYSNTRFARKYPEIGKTTAVLNAIPVDPVSTKLIKKFANNPLLDVFNTSSLTRLLKSTTAKKEHIDAVIDMLSIALK